MFYLVSQDQCGYRLVDFSESLDSLNPQPTENAASSPVIVSHEALKAAFLVDGFGIVALDEGNYLVSLDDV